jgi:hypothetical protein
MRCLEIGQPLDRTPTQEERLRRVCAPLFSSQTAALILPFGPGVPLVFSSTTGTPLTERSGCDHHDLSSTRSDRDHLTSPLRSEASLGRVDDRGSEATDGSHEVRCTRPSEANASGMNKTQVFIEGQRTRKKSPECSLCDFSSITRCQVLCPSFRSCNCFVSSFSLASLIRNSLAELSPDLVERYLVPRISIDFYSPSPLQTE